MIRFPLQAGLFITYFAKRIRLIADELIPFGVGGCSFNCLHPCIADAELFSLPLWGCSTSFVKFATTCSVCLIVGLSVYVLLLIE
ncbi:hypothetical protein Hena1_00210 [Erwinia phage Hena1]|uniref:Uncharacterized protein n=1 Tax=Erwinia phage Hena1 TaxID=2678601 RepID=A0A6B9JI32_9CAUD|nr:hypothetical protein HWC84_gp020 [Erwinia phage Hena1]QGZ16197.1 hypothetical protein Hena1_00210 [Erwinia phage Hena1]